MPVAGSTYLLIDINSRNPDFLLITLTVVFDQAKMCSKSAKQRVVVDKPTRCFGSRSVCEASLCMSAGLWHGIGYAFCHVMGKTSGKVVVFSVCSVVGQRYRKCSSSMGYLNLLPGNIVCVMTDKKNKGFTS